MPKKLEYEKSLGIVERAVKRTGSSSALDRHTKLGDVLVESSQRELLRELIREEVRSAGFGIKRSSIPIDAHVTIDHITTAVSTLAGDPGTDDD